MFKKKNKKFKMSMGFAFSEEKEMKMLSEMAKKGWIFHSFSKLGYNFKKEESRDIIYCMDTKKLKKDEQEQYFDLFKDGGWRHVCSYGDYYHFFSAAPNTTPIYTDKDTLAEKYSKGSKDIFQAVKVLGIVCVSSIILNIFIDRVIHNHIVSFINSMITGGSLGLLVVLSIAGIKMKGKTNKLEQ